MHQTLSLKLNRCSKRPQLFWSAKVVPFLWDILYIIVESALQASNSTNNLIFQHVVQSVEHRLAVIITPFLSFYSISLISMYSKCSFSKLLKQLEEFAKMANFS